MANDNQRTRDDIIRELEDDTRRRGFVEFPKMLYHPDGRQATVNTKDEEADKLRSDFHPTPQAALDVVASRDEAERKRVALANAEAANAALLESGGDPAGKSGKSK